MHRKLIAAALAVSVLPFASLDAAAGPAVTTQFGKTYPLVCEANKSDGTALKVRIMVKNTSGQVIKEGTEIRLLIMVGHRRYMSTQKAYRTVYVNDSIGFDQPKGARACSAVATLNPDVRAKSVR